MMQADVSVSTATDTARPSPVHALLGSLCENNLGPKGGAALAKALNVKATQSTEELGKQVQSRLGSDAAEAERKAVREAFRQYAPHKKKRCVPMTGKQKCEMVPGGCTN